MSEDIAKVYFGSKTEGASAFVSVERDYFGDPLFKFCANGYQSTDVHMSPDMFDALCHLVRAPRVIGHYNRLRQPKYELSCGGDPVPAYEGDDGRTLRNNQLSKEHEL